MSKKIVIIGGDAAGMGAASKIRRTHKNWEITVFEKSPHTSYSACGMPYLIAGQVDRPEKLIARSPETFINDYNIQAKTLHEVIQIDPDKQKVLVKDLEKDEAFWESYDKLLIATGASPNKPAIPKINTQGVFCLSTLQSGIEVWQFMEKHKPKKAVIVGGGYIGVEMAEALLEKGLEVTVIDRSAYVMKTLDQDMSEDICQSMRKAGIHLMLEESLTAIETDENHQLQAVKTDKKHIPADLVILGMGVKPNTKIAEEAGIKLCDTGAVLVNDKMETSISNIWAAGDCASSYHILKEKPMFIALGTIANKHGLIAGSNMAGENSTFPGVLGTAITRFNELEIARTGLKELEAKSMGLAYKVATINSSNYAGYYPGAGKIKVKLLARKDNLQIIGAQIIGKKGSAKRIDTIVAAISAKQTAQDLTMMDLAYAPPFSNVWDPVQIAARQLV
ncbi:CoA-disulfide reductase [Fontibacter flavus]|uniref:CoA-disulfide reductase n=1 Tax=Fontibacter flavus TaxID=654838 RepID=A0ABV6FTG9_9BACT